VLQGGRWVVLYREIVVLWVSESYRYYALAECVHYVPRCWYLLCKDDKCTTRHGACRS